MTDPISYILKYIFDRIPQQILEAAFRSENNMASPTNIDTEIKNKVIYRRVLPDCNLYSGKPAKIPLKPEYREVVNIPYGMLHIGLPAASVFRIPPEAREYRDIAQVTRILFPFGLTTGHMFGGRNGCTSNGNSLPDMAQQLLDSHTGGQLTPPRPILLDGNVIRLEPPQFHDVHWILECYLEYDKYFTNIGDSAVLAVRDLCLCATKLYIYNKLVILMGESYLVAGHELGVFKDLVDNYAGEEDRYSELLLEFRGANSADPSIITDLFKFCI